MSHDVFTYPTIIYYFEHITGVILQILCFTYPTINIYILEHIIGVLYYKYYVKVMVLL